MKNWTKKQKIWAVVFAVLFAAVINIITIGCYYAGKHKGRDEAVSLINDKAAEYTFYIKDNNGWQLGAGGGGEFFPDFTGVLESSYDWDDCKIHLSYRAR